MARPLRLAGAVMAVVSLWMPWYAIHIPASLTNAISTQTGSMPGLAAFANSLLSALPDHVTGWQAMSGADVAIAFLAGGLGLLAFATADRSISIVGALALVGVVAAHVVDPPGPSGVLTPKTGAWVALVGAALVLASAFMSDEPATLAPEPLPAWSDPGPASVPPPS